MDAFTDTELGRRGHAFAEAVAAHLAGNLGFVRLDAVPDKVAPGHAVALDLAGPEIPDLGPLAVAAAYAHEGGGPEFPDGAVLRAVVRDRLEDAVHAVVTDVVAVLTAARELDVAVRASNSLALLAATHDVRDHAARLVHDGFVSATGADRLPHLARYLRADRHRLTKAADNPHRDAERAWQVHQLEDACTAVRDRVRSGPADRSRDAALDEVRWMLEELRVSLFAQQLGTPAPVSDKRIRKALAEV